MPKRDFWRPKLRTATAMVHLCRARLLVAAVPFHRWRDGLGWDGPRETNADEALAKALAADVEWAARRLPLPTKCLPRAMALSWMLRRKGITHSVVVAVRPTNHRGTDDDLHAWVERDGDKLIGDLPGPWVEVFHRGPARPNGEAAQRSASG